MTTLDLEQTVLEETITKPDDVKTHIVNPPQNLHIWKPGMTAQDIVEIARKKQIFVFALCGWSFIPKLDPELFPACDDCIRIAGELMRSNGE